MASSAQKDGSSGVNAPKDSGINMKQDMAHFMQKEENPEMFRLLKLTVGRMATVPNDRKVQRDIFVEYIKEQDRRTRDCMRFPCMISYFALFSSVILMHDDVGNVSQVERNFRGMIEGTTFEGTIRAGTLGPTQTEDIFVSGHKTMADIDVVVDIWTWLNDAMIPLFIPSLTSTMSEDVQRVLRYNQILGGLQLQQIRREKVSCTDEYPDLGPKIDGSNVNPLLAGVDCYPPRRYASACFGINSTSAVGGFCPDESSSRRLAAVPGGRRLYAEKYAKRIDRADTVAAWSGDSSFEGATYTVTLHQHNGVVVAKDTLQYLQDNQWLDTATAWFGMKMFILNPDLAVYTYIVANVFFPPNGQLIPHVTLSSFPAEPYAYASTIASDMAWFAVLAHLALTTFSAFIKAIRRPKQKLGPYLSNFFNWVDMFTVLGGIGILLYWVQVVLKLLEVRDSTMDVVLGLRTVLNATTYGVPENPGDVQSYETASNDLHTTVASFASFVGAFRIGVCWYAIGIMPRFFQAFLAQPKLAVATKTIARSMTDTVHFLIVLVLVVFAYAVGGMFLFGHRLMAFSELNTAMIQCTLIALGDFDFDELSQELPFSAAVWFWTYIVLVSIIMLNMLLAIIMDWYAEVKQEADGDDPIWVQFSKVITSAWGQREWLKGSIVAEEVAKLDKHITHVDKELLRELLPLMTEDQAERLIMDADQFENRVEEQGIKISDAVKMVSWIKKNVLKIARRIEDILTVQGEEKALLAGSAEGFASSSSSRPTIRKEVTLDPLADHRMQIVESRLSQMETWLNECMCLTVQRGKDMRNRMASIEGLLRGHTEAAEEQQPFSFSAWGAGTQERTGGFDVNLFEDPTSPTSNGAVASASAGSAPNGVQALTFSA